MDKTSTQRFIQYVELDQRINQLIVELASLIMRKKECEQKRVSIEENTAAAFKKVHDKRKEIDSYELELKTISEKLFQTRKKLSLAHSPKEFFSLEHEIADLEKKQEPLDNLGLEALTDLEALRREAGEIKMREPALLAAVTKECDEIDKEERHLGPLKEALILEKTQAEKNVDPEELKRYREMKEKVPNPVVPIIRGSCSICFYSLSRQRMVEANAGQLVTCGDCHRLLYVPQAVGIPHE